VKVLIDGNDTMQPIIRPVMLILVLALTNLPAVAQDAPPQPSQIQPADTADGQSPAKLPFELPVGYIALQPPTGDEVDNDPFVNAGAKLHHSPE